MVEPQNPMSATYYPYPPVSVVAPWVGAKRHWSVLFRFWQQGQLLLLELML